MSEKNLLLGIDLEDVRDQIPDGTRYEDRMQVNVDRILTFLRAKNAFATFFTVGSVARRLPDLLREIAAQGHEIAAHGDVHTQLTRLNPESFSEDLARNLEALYDAGAPRVKGFRAPTFSLTQSTRWAHKLLADAGLRYSSSVLPAKNPLFGWPEFGQASRRLPEGIVEIPITLHRSPLPKVPLAGGVYLRVLPFFLTRMSFSRVRAAEPITTYIHPYDVDTEQERFMHPDLNGSRFMNQLMYIGRDSILSRLGALIARSKVWRYSDWVETHYEN